MLAAIAPMNVILNGVGAAKTELTKIMQIKAAVGHTAMRGIALLAQQLADDGLCIVPFRPLTGILAVTRFQT